MAVCWIFACTTKRRTCRLMPLSVHMPTVLSMEPENRRRTVLEKNRLVTMPLWPCCSRTSCPVRESQTCMQAHAGLCLCMHGEGITTHAVRHGCVP